MIPEISLSIIIPVLNWNLEPLLEGLAAEIAGAGPDSRLEVIIADDCSSDGCRVKNRAMLARYAFVSYHELPRRLGRSAIRNYLLARAGCRYILFLDADVLPDDPSFLHNYFREIRKGHRVVCGGISYSTRILTDRKYNFYFYKGIRTEWLPARQRQQVPWRYLFTANVLIRRDVMDTVGFDEGFSGYGYEDVEWAIRLQDKVGIRHIDNTCSHLGLVEKKAAFARMRMSMPNFMQLATLHPQAFAEAGVFRLVRILEKSPLSLLRRTDRILERIFLFSSVNRICFFCFQLDKAVLLARLRQGDSVHQEEGTP